MINNPLVSVVVSTYNRPYFLCELLESLVRQTVSDFEVVIVNDNGLPVGFVRDLYPELSTRIIDLNQNMQLVHTKNIGVEHARGKYIMLMDDDDAVLPMHLERLLPELDHYQFALSDAEIYDYRTLHHVRVPTEVYLHAYHRDVQMQRTFSTFLPSGCLYDKSIHDTIGVFDVDMFHYWDWDFNLRVSEHYEMRRVPIASVLYALSDHGDNMSNDDATKRIYLDRLCEKHGLGNLPTKTFRTLLDVPELQALFADSERPWDRQPIVSRLVRDRVTD